jgi:hypothetical protein
MLLTPSCPPLWVPRLATFLAVATLEVVLLLIGQPVVESLLVLIAVSGLAMPVIESITAVPGKLVVLLKVLVGLAGTTTVGATDA